MQGSFKRKVYIEENLFQRILQKDNEAFRELYEISYRPLYAFLLSLTQNAEDAKDLLQDTYMQILKNVSMYKEKGNPMAWMMKIAKNLFLMKCRKESSIAVVCYEDAENELGFEGMQDAENRMVLEKLFEILSVEERNLIIMHDISGLKHKEIAEILEMPLGTVLARYNRSMKKLKNFGTGK